MTTQPRIIDITPTWTAILPAMLAVYETGDLDARSVVTQELQNMARAADMAVNMRKAMHGK
jgi:hypothetical protein